MADKKTSQFFVVQDCKGANGENLLAGSVIELDIRTQKEGGSNEDRELAGHLNAAQRIIEVSESNAAAIEQAKADIASRHPERSKKAAAKTPEK